MFYTIKRMANGKQITMSQDDFWVGDKNDISKNLDDLFAQIPDGKWYVLINGSLVDVDMTDFRDGKFRRD